MLKIVHTDTLQHRISGTFLQQNESRPFEFGSLIAMPGNHSELHWFLNLSTLVGEASPVMLREEI